ncbi:hypothetical protein [Streptomyces sp. NPDC001153]
MSKLETGRRTVTPGGLTAWAAATGRHSTSEELTARLQGLATYTRSWRRQLRARRRPVQDVLTIEYERSAELSGGAVRGHTALRFASPCA